MVRMQVRTSDGVLFTVAPHLVEHMDTLSRIQSEQDISSCSTGSVILPRTSSLTFWKVLEWCEYHHELDGEDSEECRRIGAAIDVNDLSPWEMQFLDIRTKSLIRLMEACVDLGVPCMLRKAYSILNRWERDSLPELLKMHIDLGVFQ